MPSACSQLAIDRNLRIHEAPAMRQGGYESDVVVVAAVRTPAGKGRAGGALAEVHPVDLLASVLVEVVGRSGITAEHVEDVIVGCVQQVGEQSGNIGRSAVLAAGLPEKIPAMTLNRQCGSSQQAVAFAAQAIGSGFHDVVIAAGVESMSAIPLGSSRPTRFGVGFELRYPQGLPHQGIAAEFVASRWGVTREEADAYAARSHRLANDTWTTGGFDAEVCTVSLAPDARRDETIRTGVSAEGMANLPPAFRTEELAAKHPTLEWITTAGNSSSISDGAAAVLLMSRRRSEELGIRPRAVIRSLSVVGDDPQIMLTAPIPATRMALERCGMGLSDIDVFEVNEAFASVPLAWARELGVDMERVNPRGGAIALGHALGASGARLLTTMLHHLESSDGQLGLQTMCEAGGMANALVLERC